MNAIAQNPEFVVRDGKPVAVIIDIEEYKDMLERLEDREDLEELDRMRREATGFRPLDDFLNEYSPSA